MTTTLSTPMRSMQRKEIGALCEKMTGLSLAAAFAMLSACSAINQSSELMVGAWTCETELRENSILKYKLGISVNYLDSGRYVSRLDLAYDYREKGSLSITLQEMGSWSYDGIIYSDTRESIDVIEVTSDLVVDDGDLEKTAHEIVVQMYPVPESGQAKVKFLTTDKISVKDLGDRVERICARRIT